MKLHANAVIPKYAHATDAGLDLTAISKTTADNVTSYGTGLAVEIPDGYMGLLFPRSSVYKTGMTLANCVGVIDSGYRGEIQFKFYGGNNAYNVGDRVGQLIIVPYPKIEIEESTTLSNSDRGEGGFGSSGK